MSVKFFSGEENFRCKEEEGGKKKDPTFSAGTNVLVSFFHIMSHGGEDEMPFLNYFSFGEAWQSTGDACVVPQRGVEIAQELGLK